MHSELTLLDEVNRCEIRRFQAFTDAQHADDPKSCEMFYEESRRIEAAIVHTFQVVSHLALREPDTTATATLWMAYTEMCDEALQVLKSSKEKFPNCYADTLYDLALDYRMEASARRDRNQLATECRKETAHLQLFQS
jgi:hypothetical protein